MVTIVPHKMKKKKRETLSTSAKVVNGCVSFSGLLLLLLVFLNADFWVSRILAFVNVYSNVNYLFCVCV